MLLRISALLVAIGLVAAYIIWEARSQSGDGTGEPSQPTTAQTSSGGRDEGAHPGTARDRPSIPDAPAERPPDLVVNSASAGNVPRRFSEWLEGEHVPTDERNRIYRAIADAHVQMQQLFHEFFHSVEGEDMNAAEFGAAEAALEAELEKVIADALTDEQFASFRENFGVPILLAVSDVAAWKQEPSQ